MTTRSIPWLRVFVEGVVIVASILLAFAADAWLAERQDRGRERDVLERLEAEFVEVDSVLIEWRAAQLLRERRESPRRLMATEVGKPLREGRAEVGKSGRAVLRHDDREAPRTLRHVGTGDHLHVSLVLPGDRRS